VPGASRTTEEGICGAGNEDTVGYAEPRQTPIPESQVRIWAEVLALQMNHLSLPLPVRAGRLRGFHGAKPALTVYTLRKRTETFDWIDERVTTLVKAWAFTLNAKPKQRGVSLRKLGYRESEH